MTPEALIERAKGLAVPVVSCVRADIPPRHLVSALSRSELLALIMVLAECASPERLKAVTEAPGDEGMPPVDRAARLRAGHAERTRLERAGRTPAEIPLPVRALAAEYRQGVNARYRERKKNAATGEAAVAAAA